MYAHCRLTPLANNVTIPCSNSGFQSTKVQNPPCHELMPLVDRLVNGNSQNVTCHIGHLQRGKTIMRMCAFCRKMADSMYGLSAGSLQRSRFRENSTNILTSVARWVRDRIFRANRHFRGEMWLNRQTDRHTRTTTVTLLCMRRGVKYSMIYIHVCQKHCINCVYVHTYFNFLTGSQKTELSQSPLSWRPPPL